MSEYIVENIDGMDEDLPSHDLEEQIVPPVARPLGELQRHLQNDPDELLKDRYLCKGGGLLLVGPTGVGKSSMSMQCMLSWALGWPSFDITPARPLKSLLIQAENDDGDLAEMRDGVIAGLGLNDHDANQATNGIFVCREDTRVSARFFGEAVRPLLEEHRPDLIWIDPALAYLGGETNSQKDVGAFLRNHLNPLLREFECGAVIIHHTNKPSNGIEKSTWSGSDFAYLGSGSAEWANWPRAIMALRNVGSQTVFELIAGKRGWRLGWRSPDGVTRTTSQFIAHARGEGEIYWRPATNDEIEATRTIQKNHERQNLLMALVPANRPIAKNDLIEAGQRAKIAGIHKLRRYINDWVGSGELIETKQRRNNGPAAVMLSRPDAQLGDTAADDSGCLQGYGQAGMPVNNPHEEARLVVNDDTYSIGVVNNNLLHPGLSCGQNGTNSIDGKVLSRSQSSTGPGKSLTVRGSIPPVPVIEPDVGNQMEGAAPTSTNGSAEAGATEE